MDAAAQLISYNSFLQSGSWFPQRSRCQHGLLFVYESALNSTEYRPTSKTRKIFIILIILGCKSTKKKKKKQQDIYFNQPTALNCETFPFSHTHFMPPSNEATVIFSQFIALPGCKQEA